MATTDDNKAVVERFFGLLSKGAYDDAFALTSADSVIHQPHKDPALVSAWSGGYKGLMAAKFTDGCRFTLGLTTAEDDRVAVLAESYGDIIGGGVYANQYHWLFRVVDGVIVEIWEYANTLYAQQTFRPGQ